MTSTNESAIAALSSDLLRVTEEAAIESARTTGRGDPHGSDRAAVAAMRRCLGRIPMRGRIVIGEGERDEAPMLFIGEELGRGLSGPDAECPSVDIAVDPLEGTRACATGADNAMAVIAASGPGGLLHAPDVYMQKIVVGPSAKGSIDLDAPVTDNLKAIARSLGRKPSELVVAVLDRPRHTALLEEIRAAGARLRVVPEGDLASGIDASVRGSGVHALMGTGGAPEGVLTAAAMRCTNGEIQGRLLARHDADRRRMANMGVSAPDRILGTSDLAPGDDVVFAATGVTNGELIRGVRFFGEGARTHSLVMCSRPRRVRFVDTIHVAEGDRVAIRL